MEIIKSSIESLVIVQPKVFEDERGNFIEFYKESFFNEHFPGIHFIQDNESKSSYGVLRGLHFQKPPFEQTKLVRVAHGEILDVAVDLRKESSTSSISPWATRTNLMLRSTLEKRAQLMVNGNLLFCLVKTKNRF